MPIPLQDQIREVEARIGIQCTTMAFDAIGSFGVLSWECRLGHSISASVATARMWAGCPTCQATVRKAEAAPKRTPARAPRSRSGLPSVFSLAAEVVSEEDLSAKPVRNPKAG